MSVEFSNLLRQSKVLHLNPAQPIAITSHSGYLHRGDFGLKRPLPPSSRRSPYLKVKNLDVSISRDGQGQTDFVSAAKESLFIKRWAESGYKPQLQSGKVQGNMLETPVTLPIIGTSRFAPESYLPLIPKRKSTARKESVRETASEEPADWQSSTSHILPHRLSKLPDVFVLSGKEFDALLQILKTPEIQAEFQRFLRDHNAKSARKMSLKSPKLPTHEQVQLEEAREESITEPPPAEEADQNAEDLNLFQQAVEASGQLSTIVSDFLKQDVLVKAYQDALHQARSKSKSDAIALQGDQHNLAALNYSQDPIFDDLHYSRLVPARITSSLGSKRRNETLDLLSTSQFNASTLGLTAVIRDSDVRGMGESPFDAYAKGELSKDKPIEKQGAGMGMLVQRSVPVHDHRGDGYPNEHRPIWLYEEQLQPFKTDYGTAYVPDLQVKFAEIPKAHDFGDTTRKLGSREWVDAKDVRSTDAQKLREDDRRAQEEEDWNDSSSLASISTDPNAKVSKPPFNQKHIRSLAARRNSPVSKGASRLFEGLSKSSKRRSW